MKKMYKNQYEKQAWHNNAVVCGVDEVGRGCLAGPVVTAAVILPRNTTYRYLKDSKIMPEQDRLKATRWIMRNCIYSFGIVHHRDIDELNIWHATLKAMKKAIMHLHAVHTQEPAAILVDAMPLDLQGSGYAHIPVHNFPFGETYSSSIAAASIIAKVKRDELMRRMHSSFPHFDWHNNKGYGTPAHQAGLKEYTMSIIHRIRFTTTRLQTMAQKEEHARQQSLFGNT